MAVSMVAKRVASWAASTVSSTAALKGIKTAESTAGRRVAM